MVCAPHVDTTIKSLPSLLSKIENHEIRAVEARKRSAKNHCVATKSDIPMNGMTNSSWEMQRVRIAVNAESAGDFAIHNEKVWLVPLAPFPRESMNAKRYLQAIAPITAIYRQSERSQVG